MSLTPVAMPPITSVLIDSSSNRAWPQYRGLEIHQHQRRPSLVDRQITG
jgi:hypothetical protein